MFTGIIEEIGKITNILPIAGGKKIKISARNIMDDIKVNDSVCINGVCLTVVRIDGDSFWVDAVGATLEKSTFSDVHVSNTVNLERALKLNDRSGGHFVLGHVNAIGFIKEIKKLGDNYFLKIHLPAETEKYLRTAAVFDKIRRADSQRDRRESRRRLSDLTVDGGGGRVGEQPENLQR